MFQLVVAWPGRTYGCYHWREVQYAQQHHRYHTKTTFLKARAKNHIRVAYHPRMPQ